MPCIPTNKALLTRNIDLRPAAEQVHDSSEGSLRASIGNSYIAISSRAKIRRLTTAGVMRMFVDLFETGTCIYLLVDLLNMLVLPSTVF